MHVIRYYCLYYVVVIRGGGIYVTINMEGRLDYTELRFAQRVFRALRIFCALNICLEYGTEKSYDTTGVAGRLLFCSDNHVSKWS